jgi:hypothetical protein
VYSSDIRLDAVLKVSLLIDPRKPLGIQYAFDFRKGRRYISATHIVRSDLMEESPRCHRDKVQVSEGTNPDMNRQLMILCLGLLLLGCSDLGVEPKLSSHSAEEVSVIPGVVWAIFAEGTTPQDAEQLVNSLGLSFDFGPKGTPLSGEVSVPIGSEDEWVVKLKTYPIVKSAGRMGVVLQQ